MTNYQFLQKYVELQKDIMFDEVFDLVFATICYCQTGDSEFWNNALVNSVLGQEQIEAVVAKLKGLNRKSAFFFENREDLAPFAQILERQGYTQAAEDSMMFHSGENINTSRFSEVKKVTSDEDLEIFIEIFDKCYQKDDPLNPYGELGEYLESARIAWKKFQNTNHLEYFIAFENDQPVAVASLTNYGGIGYISNVGSLLSVRGKGFGKLVTHYCVDQSRKSGNTLHCLATEEGTNPNLFYKAIGFETRFTAKLLAK